MTKNHDLGYYDAALDEVREHLPKPSAGEHGEAEAPVDDPLDPEGVEPSVEGAPEYTPEELTFWEEINARPMEEVLDEAIDRGMRITGSDEEIRAGLFLEVVVEDRATKARVAAQGEVDDLEDEDVYDLAIDHGLNPSRPLEQLRKDLVGIREEELTVLPFARSDADTEPQPAADSAPAPDPRERTPDPSPAAVDEDLDGGPPAPRLDTVKSALVDKVDPAGAQVALTHLGRADLIDDKDPEATIAALEVVANRVVSTAAAAQGFSAYGLREKQVEAALTLAGLDLEAVLPQPVKPSPSVDPTRPDGETAPAPAPATKEAKPPEPEPALTGTIVGSRVRRLNDLPEEAIYRLAYQASRGRPHKTTEENRAALANIPGTVLLEGMTDIGETRFRIEKDGGTTDTAEVLSKLETASVGDLLTAADRMGVDLDGAKGNAKLINERVTDAYKELASYAEEHGLDISRLTPGQAAQVVEGHRFNATHLVIVAEGLTGSDREEIVKRLTPHQVRSIMIQHGLEARMRDGDETKDREINREILGLSLQTALILYTRNHDKKIDEITPAELDIALAEYAQSNEVLRLEKETARLVRAARMAAPDPVTGLPVPEAPRPPAEGAELTDIAVPAPGEAAGEPKPARAHVPITDSIELGVTGGTQETEPTYRTLKKQLASRLEELRTDGVDSETITRAERLLRLFEDDIQSAAIIYDTFREFELGSTALAFVDENSESGQYVNLRSALEEAIKRTGLDASEADDDFLVRIRKTLNEVFYGEDSAPDIDEDYLADIKRIAADRAAADDEFKRPPKTGFGRGSIGAAARLRFGAGNVIQRVLGRKGGEATPAAPSAPKAPLTDDERAALEALHARGRRRIFTSLGIVTVGVVAGAIVIDQRFGTNLAEETAQTTAELAGGGADAPTDGADAVAEVASGIVDTPPATDVGGLQIPIETPGDIPPAEVPSAPPAAPPAGAEGIDFEPFGFTESKQVLGAAEDAGQQIDAEQLGLGSQSGEIVLPDDFNAAEVFDGTLDQSGEWVSHSYEELGKSFGLEGEQLQQFTQEVGKQLIDKNPDFDFTQMQVGVDYSDQFELLSRDEVQGILNGIEVPAETAEGSFVFNAAEGDGVTNALDSLAQADGLGELDGDTLHEAYEKIESELEGLDGTYPMDNGDVGIASPGEFTLPEDVAQDAREALRAAAFETPELPDVAVSAQSAGEYFGAYGTQLGLDGEQLQQFTTQAAEQAEAKLLEQEILSYQQILTEDEIIKILEAIGFFK